MKKLLALGLGLFAAGYVNAQNIKITNNSCDAVEVIIYGDDEPCDNWLYFSSTYTIPSMSSLNLSMHPGGPYAQVNWVFGNLPPVMGDYFSSIKVFGLAGSWSDYMSNECMGKTTFAQKAKCGTVQGVWTDDPTTPGGASVLIY
ncbi:hypothetical protein [Taibaiella chishuiensis]|uniref:Uncharacterized protein n=1 Tax=Taibaiella chishuiensis TaxID=1434707 RepID=A0A2P8D8D0_9BACT|nr:hypothetical protein [Taibaiella chishuiensis]PSK93463.1 hypothetical protein B0I18_102433 [Taibaiella chishuiensis]